LDSVVSDIIPESIKKYPMAMERNEVIFVKREKSENLWRFLDTKQSKRIAYPETCAHFEADEVPDTAIDILGKTFDVVVKIVRDIFLCIE
jgi:hypothetical protein